MKIRLAMLASFIALPYLLLPAERKGWSTALRPLITTFLLVSNKNFPFPKAALEWGIHRSLCSRSSVTATVTSSSLLHFHTILGKVSCFLGKKDKWKEFWRRNSWRYFHPYQLQSFCSCSTCDLCEEFADDCCSFLVQTTHQISNQILL